MLRKHQITNTIKHKTNQLLYSSPMYHIYDVYIEYNNIKHRIRFYEKDCKMLHTLNKLIDSYSQYYLKDKKFNICSIKKEEESQIKTTYPLLIDKKNHNKKVTELNQIRSSMEPILYAKYGHNYQSVHLDNLNT